MVDFVFLFLASVPILVNQNTIQFSFCLSAHLSLLIKIIPCIIPSVLKVNGKEHSERVVYTSKLFKLNFQYPQWLKEKMFWEMNLSRYVSLCAHFSNWHMYFFCGGNQLS